LSHPAILRFSVLAVRRGLSIGTLHSSTAGDAALVLAAAAAAFKPDHVYAEREVNDILRDWLAQAGAMLDVDHVELRRWLVDSRLLDRDGFGRAYRRGSPASEAGVLAAALEDHDLNRIAHDARERDAVARDERKRQWELRKRPADA
jgi:hypothetical protein